MELVGRLFNSRSISEDEDLVQDRPSSQYGNVKTDRNVDKSIKESEHGRKCIKILILGSGECGKSTIFKQMKIINISDFSPEERDAFKEIIYLNILSDTLLLLEGAEKLGIIPQNEEARVRIRCFHILGMVHVAQRLPECIKSPSIT